MMVLVDSTRSAAPPRNPGISSAIWSKSFPLAARVARLDERAGEVLLRAAPEACREDALPLAVQLTPAAVRDLGLHAGARVHLLIKTRGCRVLSSLEA